MDNGIGLQTPRGSSTNGYIQTNKFFVKPRASSSSFSGIPKPPGGDDAASFGCAKKANKEVLEHDRKRQIQPKLLLLEETLSDQGYTDDEIVEKLSDAKAVLEEEVASALAADSAGGASDKTGKKKRAPRVANGDKGGRGLRQFSMKVCEKVESKGRTTYNEVADELVAEFTDPNNNMASPDQQQQYDEKNIRRRVYDALNVLMAMDIISKDKKEIQWKGLPRTSLNDIEELKAERIALRSRIEKKSAYLKELQEQYTGLQNLVERNEQLFNSGNAPSGGVALPFILIQTRPHATVEVEISEDMQLVHFDFNSTPFELHDDAYVLKAMRFCEKQPGESSQEPMLVDGEGSSSLTLSQSQSLHPSKPSGTSSGALPNSPPIPGILKGRVKHEH